VVIEEVRNDVLDPHFMRNPKTPALTQAAHRGEYPISPNGLRA
jgi:hypothetical protein